MERLWHTLAAAGSVAVLVSATVGSQGHASSKAAGLRGTTLEVGYTSPTAIADALASTDAAVVRSIPRIRVAEIRLPAGRTAAALRARPGIRFVATTAPRTAAGSVSPLATAADGSEWQLHATAEDLLSQAELSAAASVTIGVVDTGADLDTPVLAAKHPKAFDAMTGSTRVTDRNGHGTFVASLAAGAITPDGRMVGFGGDAKLLVVQAAGADAVFSDVDEAAAIVYAVDHGCKIINVSVGGTTTSPTERSAVRYAINHGVLLVAPVGNEYSTGNPAEYPAALLQPVGSNGRGGAGLAVGASTEAGGRAAFSNTGSFVSLVAPGLNVFGALSAQSSPARYPRLATSAGGLYGYGSGTSFAAPEVAGAAALVWGANPALTAAQVARLLKDTASGRGVWTPELGYGVIDVAAAVAAAEAQPSATARVSSR